MSEHRTSASDTLTISQAMRIIDLYATGCYAQAMLADSLGISEHLVWRVLSFRRPYDLLRDSLPAETVARVEWVRLENQRTGRGGPGSAQRVRWVRSLAARGYRNPAIAHITGLDYSVVYRIVTGRAFRGVA